MCNAEKMFIRYLLCKRILRKLEEIRRREEADEQRALSSDTINLHLNQPSEKENLFPNDP